VQVLEALEHKPYDVILMDMHMPTMDGLTATRLVCERWSRDRRPRIIALSASDLPEDRARWLAAGADGWVGKSLPLDDLRRVLAGSAASRPGPARLPSQHTPPDGVPSGRREPTDAPAHILEVFLRDAEAQVSALRDAVARKDAGGVERVAHTLKGSAAMVGAASVAGSCGDLIHCVRQGKLDDAAGILEALQAHVAAIGRTLVPPPAHAGRPRASEAIE
jgi:CheY-like chemotaxis protein